MNHGISSSKRYCPRKFPSHFRLPFSVLGFSFPSASSQFQQRTPFHGEEEEEEEMPDWEEEEKQQQQQQRVTAVFRVLIKIQQQQQPDLAKQLLVDLFQDTTVPVLPWKFHGVRGLEHDEVSNEVAEKTRMNVQDDIQENQEHTVLDSHAWIGLDIWMSLSHDHYQDCKQIERFIKSIIYQNENMRHMMMMHRKEDGKYDKQYGNECHDQQASAGSGLEDVDAVMHDGVCSVEILVTAPGYLPIVEKRFKKQDFIMTQEQAFSSAHDVSLFENLGMVICAQVIGHTDLQAIRGAVFAFIAELESHFALYHPQINYGQDAFVFREIASRETERFDALLNLDHSRWQGLRTIANESAPWIPAIEAILDHDWKLASVSVVYSKPGANDQKWHSDGVHLGPEAGADGLGHAKPYGVGVFLPLIDLNPEVGFTQFFLKSHKASLVGFGATCLVLAADFDGIISAGESLLYDYRLMHRGMANRSNIIRPVLHFLYTKPFYQETRNFGRKSIYAADSMSGNARTT